MDEHRRLREIKPQIVFATPGRLLDHVQKGNVETQFATRLFIDEYDKCLELGFQAEMAALLAAFGRVRQYVLTSATTAIDVPVFIDEAGSRLNFLPESKDQRTTTLLVPSPDKDKLETLARLLSYVKGAPAIVFVAHRESTERIGRYLREQGFIAQIYHGGMEQDDRERSLYKFRAGSSNVLVATDLAARGLDIPSACRSPLSSSAQRRRLHASLRSRHALGQRGDGLRYQRSVRDAARFYLFRWRSQRR